MIYQHDQRLATWADHFILRAVPAEDEAAIRGLIVDVAPDRPDRIVLPRKDPHIDAALVIAINKHHMFIWHATNLAAAEYLVIESRESDPVFGLDDGQNIRVE